MPTENIRGTKLQTAQKQVSKRPRTGNNVQNTTRKATNGIGDTREERKTDARKNRRRAHAEKRVQTLSVKPNKLIGHNIRGNIVDCSGTHEPSTSGWDKLRIA